MSKRAFYQVVQKLRDFLEDHEDVNTVMFGANQESDMFKINIYPLAVINPSNPSILFNGGNTLEFTFEIAVLDIRDFSDDDVEDKFRSNDNKIDNLAVSFSVINDLVNYLNNTRDENLIELVSVENITPYTFAFLKGLDGFAATFTLRMPNLC